MTNIILEKDYASSDYWWHLRRLATLLSVCFAPLSSIAAAANNNKPWT